MVFDRLKGMALVLYNEIEYAQAAVKETKGRKIGGNKIKVCRMTSKTKQKKRNKLYLGLTLSMLAFADCQSKGVLSGTRTSQI